VSVGARQVGTDPRSSGARRTQSPSTPRSAAASERASWDSWRRAARRSTPSPPSGWRCTAGPNLATSTLKTYAVVWDRHISPRLGSYELRHLSAEACQRFAAELAADGVDPGARRNALALLGGVLQRGVEWGRLPGNPVRVVRKPSGSRARAVRPFAPTTVEAMRRYLLGRGRVGDATLVSVLAYAGLRPGEALGLSWAHVRTNTLLVERAVSDGVLKATKTGHTRSVRLLGPVREDLAEWRRVFVPSGDSALIFPTLHGRPWRLGTWQNWRRRVFTPAAAAAGLSGTRPYDLRHSAASLWLHEGRTIVEVATWMGHSGQMALSTYLHVMSDLGDERVSAEEAIRRARANSDVPISYLPDAAEGKQ
jgi:integrase